MANEKIIFVGTKEFTKIWKTLIEHYLPPTMSLIYFGLNRRYIKTIIP